MWLPIECCLTILSATCSTSHEIVQSTKYEVRSVCMRSTEILSGVSEDRVLRGRGSGEMVRKFYYRYDRMQTQL